MEEKEHAVCGGGADGVGTAPLLPSLYTVALQRGFGVPPKTPWLGSGSLLSLSSVPCQAACPRLPPQIVNFPRAVTAPPTLVPDRSPWGESRVNGLDPTKWCWCVWVERKMDRTGPSGQRTSRSGCPGGGCYLEKDRSSLLMSRTQGAL